MMKRVMALLLTLLTLLAIGCALAQTEGSITPTVDPLMVPLGEFKKVRYNFSPAYLEKSGFVFESSNPEVATVNRSGQAKGISLGECTITITSARDESIKAALTVKVVKPVEKVRLNETKVKLKAGDTFQVTYTCLPENATEKTAVFESSNENVATVDENGVITAVKKGTSKISVISADGQARNTLQVTVVEMPTSVTFKQPEYTLAVGRGIKLKPKVAPSSANDRSVVWSSSDEGVATVDNSGNVKARGVGDVIISAACKADPSVVGTTVVHCVQPIKSIQFDVQEVRLTAGETAQLNPSFTPADATITAVEYIVANEQVCTVDQNGLVTAVGGGSTTVTLRSTENTRRKATVTVVVYVPVEGVIMDDKVVRVPLGEHVFATARMIPSDATYRGMVWRSSDPAVAMVTNQTNRPRIEGLKWGVCELTGTTMEGGFTTSVTVQVGVPYEAVQVESRADGLVTLRNNSNMHITGIALVNENGESTGTVAVDLAAESTVQIPVEITGPVAVSAWETDTGYVNTKGNTIYSYRISKGLLEWK